MKILGAVVGMVIAAVVNLGIVWILNPRPLVVVGIGVALGFAGASIGMAIGEEMEQ